MNHLRSIKHLSAGLLSGLALVAAGCGGSSTGPPPAPHAMSWALQSGASGSQEAYQSLQFAPTSITIDAGDSVTWTSPSGEPHTVTFLGNRTSLPPPNDPSVPALVGGSTYDGTAYTSSGFRLLGQTYTLVFPKPGTYVYYCLIHGGLQGGMVGTITVQRAGAPYPQGQSQYTSAGQTLLAADLANAARSIGAFPYPEGGSHLAAGIAPGLSTGPPATSTVVRFLDSKSASGNQSVTVPIETTVTWTNLSNNFPHTVTFGVAGQPFPMLAPFAPPSGGTTYDGSVVTNSGVMSPGQSLQPDVHQARHVHVPLPVPRRHRKHDRNGRRPVGSQASRRVVGRLFTA